MGVKDFTKVFSATKKVDIKTIKNENLAVDAFYELFRSNSMQYAAGLTNPEGHSTLYLKIALENACRRKASGSNDIWCWDAREPRKTEDPKMETIKQRQEIKTKNLEEIAKLEKQIMKVKEMEAKMGVQELLKLDPTYENDLKVKQHEIEVLKARNPESQHFNTMVLNVQYILKMLGITMAIAEVGCDAEQLAAQLCREEKVEGVITADTDCLVYGAPKQYKKIVGESGKYNLYVLEDCLNEHKIEYEDMIKIATVLGCDLCDGTPRVGPKTVVAKVKDNKITYTETQIRAQKIFMDHTPKKYKLLTSECSNVGLDELCDWLVKKQGFKQDRIEKLLKPFYKV